MKKLIIRNFGPISNAEVELKNFNFFIGNQGVGKSTLAKMLCIVTNYSLYLTGDNDTLSYFSNFLLEYNLMKYLKNDSYIEFCEEGLFIDEKGNECQYAMKFLFKESGCTKEVVYNDQKICGDSLLMLIAQKTFNKLFIKKLDEILENVKKTGIKPNQEFYENFQSLLNLTKDTFYIPAERIMFSVLPKLLPALTLAQVSVPRILLHFIVEYNNAKESFNSYDIPLLGIKYLHKDDDDYVVVNETQTIPLNASSSGMQSTIPLLLTMDYAINKGRYRSYVIEEPECNLYPNNQVELIDQIVGIINRQKTDFRPSLTVTTHSPYIINYLNVLTRRYAKQTEKTSMNVEDLAVYYVTNEGSVTDLMSVDNRTQEKVVNTVDLSEVMSDIYSEFKSLG